MSLQDSDPVLFTPKANALTTNPAALVISEHAASIQWFVPQPFPIDFCKGLQDCTWHVARCTNCSANGTIVFPPFRSSNGVSPTPIGPAVRSLSTEL